MREAQVRRVWQRVDGVLLLDKSGGMTSNSALQAARRLYSAAKAGHTGTLDPLATGLLPLCFGEATKFSADLLDADKTYEADVRFGIVTDTGDSEGQVLETRPAAVSPAATIRCMRCRVSGATEKSAKRAAKRATRRMRTGSSAKALVT